MVVVVVVVVEVVVLVIGIRVVVLEGLHHQVVVLGVVEDEGLTHHGEVVRGVVWVVEVVLLVVGGCGLGVVGVQGVCHDGVDFVVEPEVRLNWPQVDSVGLPWMAAPGGEGPVISVLLLTYYQPIISYLCFIVLYIYIYPPPQFY